MGVDFSVFLAHFGVLFFGVLYKDEAFFSLSLEIWEGSIPRSYDHLVMKIASI